MNCCARIEGYPVSDAKDGGLPPPLPAKNADARNVDAKFASTDRSGSPKNRSGERLDGIKKGSLADSHKATASSGEPSTRPQETSSSDGSGLGAAKDTKRRRRRRWPKKRRNNPDTTNAVSADNAAAPLRSQKDEAPTASTEAGKRKRKRRRNRKRRPADNAGDAVSVDQQKITTDSHSNSHGKQNKQTAGQRSRNAKPSLQNAYAALDLGTNNCRLLVAVPQQPGRFRVVDAFSRIVRLGEGLAASGRLSEQAMDRAVGALKACAGKLENRQVKGVRLIATEACRRATNGIDFLQRVEREAGLKLEIVDRETEARLAVAGCSSLVDRKASGAVLFDIGGGSSELALIDMNKRKRHDLGPAIVSWTSLPVGVVTLSEKHGGGRLVTRQVFENMVDEVLELLNGFEGKDALKGAAEKGEIHLLGTSGTVTTLAGIHLKLPRYDRRQVDGTWMASKDIDEIIDALVDMSFEQRTENPCIGNDRADLVLAGCAILVAIQRLWPCPRLRVADRGLREGLLTEMMNADNAWKRRPKYFRQRRT